MGGGTVLVQKEQGAATPLSSAPSSLSVPPPGMAAAAQGGNPLATAQNWVTEKQARFQTWLAQQPIAVEAFITTGLSAAQGGFLGGLISALGKDLQSETAKNPGMGTLESSKQANPFLSLEGTGGSPLVQARNFAVLTGANTGISCVLKRIRGVDDVKNSMAAAFGSGFLFSLVSTPGSPNIASAVGTGAFFAAIQGGLHKVGQMMPGATASTSTSTSNEDLYYSQARSMLTNLGLARYERNFRKGLLTDATLPLLSDSALQEVGIPPGPRLVILDRVRKDKELVKGRR